jgi:hypothetical protein
MQQGVQRQHASPVEIIAYIQRFLILLHLLHGIPYNRFTSHCRDSTYAFASPFSPCNTACSVARFVASATKENAGLTTETPRAQRNSKREFQPFISRILHSAFSCCNPSCPRVPASPCLPVPASLLVNAALFKMKPQICCAVSHSVA